MPIFRKKVQKQKSRESKLVEDIDDFKNISLRVTDSKVLKFVSGSWIVLKKNQAADNLDDATELIKENRKLDDENRMLNAKVDILLDLLSEHVAEK